MEEEADSQNGADDRGKGKTPPSGTGTRSHAAPLVSGFQGLPRLPCQAVLVPVHRYKNQDDDTEKNAEFHSRGSLRGGACEARRSRADYPEAGASGYEQDSLSLRGEKVPQPLDDPMRTNSRRQSPIRSKWRQASSSSRRGPGSSLESSGLSNSPVSHARTFGALCNSRRINRLGLRVRRFQLPSPAPGLHLPAMLKPPRTPGPHLPPAR